MSEIIIIVSSVFDEWIKLHGLDLINVNGGKKSIPFIIMLLSSWERLNDTTEFIYKWSQIKCALNEHFIVYFNY